MLYIGDTKAGTYIASDRYGNKYYENLQEELPCETTPQIFRAQTDLCSANALGRILSTRVQRRSDRTGLARMDELHGR